MMLTSTFLLPKSESHRVSITPAHPQLRDLLICPPESNSLCVVRHSSIASHDRLGQKPIEYTRLGFAPSTLVYGCGLIAAGGQAAELALKAAAPSSTWCLQTNLCPTAPMNKINNSICIAPSPLSASTPRLLVSNNDATIKVFDVKGRIPDFGRAGRRRKRERDRWADDEDREGEEQVEEMGVHDEEGGECALEKVELGEIAMTTAINHCSVSPDGRRLVAVGDTNEIFLFDVNLGSGTYTKTHTFIGSDDASFSTDWSGTSDKFAVASQDGFVNVYDIRSLPSSSSSSSAYPPRKLAALKTTQSGPPGAARKVKFSPGRLSSELLAFTEHRSAVHIVDARTFATTQIISIPPSPPSTSSDDPSSEDAPLPFTVTYSSADVVPSQLSSLIAHITTRSLDPMPRPRPDETQEDFIVRILEGASGSPPPSTSTPLSRAQAAMDILEAEVAAGTRVLPPSLYSPPPWAMTETRTATTTAEGERRVDSGWTRVDLQPGYVAPNRLRPNRVRRRVQVEEDEEDQEEDEEDCPPELALAPPPSRLPPPLLRRPFAPPYPPSSFRHPQVAHPHPILSGYSPLTGYQATSFNFPLESSPEDLLGLDWDEWGENVFVATRGVVWEYTVDGRGRRCFGGFGVL